MSEIALCLSNKNAEKENMDRTEFENLRIYHLAEELADLAWEVAATGNLRLFLS